MKRGEVIAAMCGSSWTVHELKYFRVVINDTDDRHFFGSPVGGVDLKTKFPASALTNANPYKLPTRDRARRFLRLLDVVMKRRPGQESPVNDLAVETLRLLDYEAGDYVLNTCTDIPLFMCGEYTHAKTDVCLERSDGILMLIQEDKSHYNSVDAVPQLVAEVVAAFQVNNFTRKSQGMKELKDWICPCVIMHGSYPLSTK